MNKIKVLGIFSIIIGLTIGFLTGDVVPNLSELQETENRGE